MAAQPYEQRELAIPMMNALNRAVQNNLITSGDFPYASAAAFIAAGVFYYLFNLIVAYAMRSAEKSMDYYR